MSKYSKDFIQYSDEKVKSETKNLTLYFITHITLYIVLLFFLIFFAWYTVFISTHRFYAVSGPSMKYTLNRQIDDNDTESAYDAVYIDLITKPKIFDIVVVEKPNTKSAIKRLMAEEGDYISIVKGKTEAGEDCFYFYRIPQGTNLEEFSDEEAKLQEESGENGYKIRGYEDWYKNRLGIDISIEVDGTLFSNNYELNFYNTFLNGYENNSEYNYHISSQGFIFVQVPPNQVFCMGDNRGHSTDGRERGFYNKEYLVGRTEFIIYNFNFGNRLLEVVKFYFNQVEEFFAR